MKLVASCRTYSLVNVLFPWPHAELVQFVSRFTYSSIREVGLLLAVSLGKHLTKKILRVCTICTHILYGYGAVLEDDVFSGEELLDTLQGNMWPDPAQKRRFASDDS